MCILPEHTWPTCEPKVNAPNFEIKFDPNVKPKVTSTFFVNINLILILILSLNLICFLNMAREHRKKAEGIAEDVLPWARVGSRVDWKVNNAYGNVLTRVTPRTPNRCKSEWRTSSQMGHQVWTWVNNKVFWQCDLCLTDHNEKYQLTKCHFLWNSKTGIIE